MASAATQTALDTELFHEYCDQLVDLVNSFAHSIKPTDEFTDVSGGNDVFSQWLVYKEEYVARWESNNGQASLLLSPPKYDEADLGVFKDSGQFRLTRGRINSAFPEVVAFSIHQLVAQHLVAELFRAIASSFHAARQFLKTLQHLCLEQRLKAEWEECCQPQCRQLSELGNVEAGHQTEHSSPDSGTLSQKSEADSRSGKHAWRTEYKTIKKAWIRAMKIKGKGIPRMTFIRDFLAEKANVALWKERHAGTINSAFKVNRGMWEAEVTEAKLSLKAKAKSEH